MVEISGPARHKLSPALGAQWIARATLMLTLLATGCGRVAHAADLDQLVARADIEAGQAVALRCKACHTLGKDGRHVLGPNLWNIVGRDIGQAAGFTRYSDAMKERIGNWDLASLDAFLEAPKAWLPGTRMTFPGIQDKAERISLLAYLQTLNDRPVASQQTTTRSRSGARSTIDFGGLPDGDGREATAVICSACHSLKTVTQQGLSSDRWDELMDWMVEKQGMAPLDADTRTRIVGYLTDHFGPGSRGRGLSVPNSLTPTMPMMPSTMAPAPPPLPAEGKY